MTRNTLADTSFKRMAIPRSRQGRTRLRTGTPSPTFHTVQPQGLTALGKQKPTDFSQTPIRAVLVFHDPRNWALDVQVTIDVLRARGIVGGPYLPHPSFGNAQEEGLPPPVELVFCNPDLIWRSDFPRSRMGQGAFKEAFQAVYKVRRSFSMGTCWFELIILFCFVGDDWGVLSAYSVWQAYACGLSIRGGGPQESAEGSIGA
jgi:hypothetical protein